MHILIAPNAFKNSLTAPAAAEAIRRGLEKSGCSFTHTFFPVGDGGDGTADLLNDYLGAMRVTVDVHDPLGRMISSHFGWVEAKRMAIVELANASGLRLLQPAEYHPLRASTLGTGETIRKAIDLGARLILLGIGGSATVDGAAGILTALGIRFLDPQGRTLEAIPEKLLHMESIDLSGLDPRTGHLSFTVLCDVTNPLLGIHGAAAVFGPQKGADAQAVTMLESFLQRFSSMATLATGKHMASVSWGGAAGGVAAGMATFLPSRLVNGIEYFLGMTDFEAALENCDLLITGEGCLDRQTLQGKAPLGVALHARRKGIRVIAMAGRIIPSDRVMLMEYFDELVEITPASADPRMALLHAAANLERAATEIGEHLKGTG